MRAAALAVAIAAGDVAAIPRRPLIWSGAAIGGVMSIEAIWLLLALPGPG
jgi:hypothetical protein